MLFHKLNSLFRQFCSLPFTEDRLNACIENAALPRLGRLSLFIMVVIVVIVLRPNDNGRVGVYGCSQYVIVK
jgi:hypothetical protein